MGYSDRALAFLGVMTSWGASGMVRMDGETGRGGVGQQGSGSASIDGHRFSTVRCVLPRLLSSGGGAPLLRASFRYFLPSRGA